MSDDDCRCGYDDEIPVGNVCEPKRSSYNCPVCRMHLSLEDTLSGGVAVFCTHANCPSYSCTEGAEAKNEEEAEYKLKRMVEQEVGMND